VPDVHYLNHGQVSCKICASTQNQRWCVEPSGSVWRVDGAANPKLLRWRNRNAVESDPPPSGLFSLLCPVARNGLQAAELEAKLSKLTTAEPAEEAGSDDDDDDFGLSITAGAGKKKSGAKKGGKGKKKPAKKGEPCIRDCGCRRLPR